MSRQTIVAAACGLMLMVTYAATLVLWPDGGPSASAQGYGEQPTPTPTFDVQQVLDRLELIEAKLDQHIFLTNEQLTFIQDNAAGERGKVRVWVQDSVTTMEVD